MNLSTRLTVAMVSLVLLTALAVGQLGLVGAIISALCAGLLAAYITRSLTQPLKSQALREKLFATIVESANDAIFTVDSDCVITTWNPAAERLFGYRAQEAIGKPATIIATPAQQEEQMENFSNIKAGRRLENFETTRMRKDGSIVYLSYNTSPLLSESGEIIGASAIAHDINERKQADAMFRVAVESSPGAMVMADAAGKIVLVNAETERMFGYAHSELVGMPIETLIPKKLREAHGHHRNHYAAEPSRRRMGAGRDLFGVRKDGSEVAVEIGLNPIKTPNGVVVLAAIVDITERKRHEKEIAERALELQRSNAELEQFAYVASHDLQEPLRMVASYGELLAERYQGKLDDKADKYIAYAVDGAKRMQRLVNDLLTYSRVGTQGRELHPTDANIVAGHVLRALKGKIEEGGVSVEIGPLPVVNADEGQLGQLFQNLIGNALKFHADRPLHVRVGAHPSRQGWTFFVEDNGIGIDPQYAERVFQMFQRLHDREAYEGSGIGLTIAKKIVERHGGRIWFESEPGRGTTFFFTLPETQEKAA